ncbi:IS3 family transposase [Corynebacterium pseudodiphtheriticum]|uniref:IS3 family transposase n=1 Tax=Corynebacterium pseudodiphtheriticum TaxID=37637 RepID=UPI003D300B4A
MNALNFGFKRIIVPTTRVRLKKELIHTRRWGDVVEVEIKPFEWVHWWNEERLHQSLGY